MEIIIYKKNNFRSKNYGVSSNRYKFFSGEKNSEESEYIKSNKEKNIGSKNKANDNKFGRFPKLSFFKKFKKYFLFYLLICILLNINGILCESCIIVKINKSGRHKILYNGGVEDTNHWCYEVPDHTPTRITINENEIDTSTREYNFIYPYNTVKLYYEDSKNDFRCLFYGCSDIDEIDASNLITSNAVNMVYMFYQCSSLTSLNINNFNTEKVVYMRAMFGFCSSLISINISHFATPFLEDIALMFEGCSNLTSIYLLNFDTKEVVAMDRLFKGCSSLTTLDISNFETSKVKWMSEMFKDCYLLTTLDLSNFNTSSVEYFDLMFDSCKSLTSLNLSNFNTEKAIIMLGMFNGCSNLKYLDIHSFDTSSVENMGWMFCGCLSLESLDITNFKTDNVNNMRIMFGNCISLTTLDLTNFNTSLVQDMGWMFYRCINLTSINLSNFNTISTRDFDVMFYGCTSLKSIDVTKFNTSNAHNMSIMFGECSSLTNLDLSNFDTSNVVNMNRMLSGCSSLESLDLSKFDTSQVIDMSQMFRNCENLKSLNLNNFNTLNVENMEWMFYECYKLESLDLSSFRTPKVKSMGAMFVRCKSLTTIDVSQFDTSQVIDAFNMFEDCPLITSLDLSRFTTSSIENMRAMFLNNKKLISLDLSNFNFSKVTNIQYMFTGCSCLKYINLKSLVLYDNIEYTGLIDNSLINPIICIDDMKSLNKIISLYQCQKMNDSENWGEYKDYITNDNNRFINNCLLSKNDINCYQICSFYYYYDEILNKYICTEKLECPKPYDKLIDGKNECVKLCNETMDYQYYFPILNKCLKKCPNNFEENKEKPFYCIFKKLSGTMQKSAIVEMMKSGMMDDILSQVIASNESYITEDDTDLHIISTLSGNLKRTDFSSIDFGDCEQLIRNQNKDIINENEELILYEIEHSVKGFNIPIIEYLLFTEQGSLLNLSICNNMTIQYYIPVSINENELDLYNPNNELYKDECKKVKNDDGVDMTLYERTLHFNEGNLSLCEKNCIYQGFIGNNKKVGCDCNIKDDLTFYNDETNQGDLLYKMDSSKSSSNIKVTKCFNNVFNTPKKLFSNSGFLILFIILIVFIIIFIIFCKKGRQLIINKIDEIIYKKFCEKDKTVSITKNNIKKFSKNKRFKKTKSRRSRKIKNKIQIKKFKKIPKLNQKLNSNSKNEMINPRKIICKENFINNGPNKNLEQIEDKPDKENDYELNTLTYIQAIKYDKRTCCDYYTSLLKNKQLFLFTFCSFNDYNSGIIKKFIFFFSFSIHYTISALFFNDDTMHQIYIDGGKYNISYQLPKILISAACSTVFLRLILETLILTDRNVLQVKHQITKSQAEQMKSRVLKCINIKFAIFFVFNFFLLVLFWFYLTCLNDTYENTQIYLIENTFIAFGISFCYPFIWNIFPSIFRACSLTRRKPNKGCLYSFSKILQLI